MSTDNADVQKQKHLIYPIWKPSEWVGEITSIGGKFFL